MKKFKTIGISLLMAACAACLSLAFVACKGGEDKATYGAGEEGFYYYDGADFARYMLSLQSGAYMITAGGETQYSGSYSYDEEKGEISFDGGSFSATMGDSALSLDMGSSGYSFKAYKYFDVTYVDESGKVVATESVLNGQSATEISAEKDGYWFVGWYEDSSNSTEFAFNTSIAGDTTVYGWYIEKNPQATEYVITLDYGDGTHETVSTMNGAVWTLPSDGILGWWVSATNKSDELTCKYNIGDVFTSDTTLFAVYSGMGASVTSAGITWENVTGADVSVTIYSGDGSVAISRSSTSSSNASFAPTGFSSLSTGTYAVEVTSGSTTEYLTYVVNGLSRVSKSSVDIIVNGDGRVISFAPVEGATGYEITITDGVKTVTENLGSRTYYNFSSWEMTKEGLTFTVTAYADGYVSSVSDEYIYVLVLSDVSMEIIDDVVTWNRVDGALEYEVIIYGKDDAVLESFYTTDTSYSLKYYDAGTYTISVQPRTDGYYSEAKKYDAYSKSTLAAPKITGVTNYSVSWSGVTGAVSYEVMVGDATYTVEGTETLVFSEIPAGLGTYEISVKAKDADGNDSPYSDVVYASEGEFSSAVRYERNTLYWDYDIKAASYVISVNGVETTVSAGSSWEITLNKAGDNEIVVTAYDAGGVSLGQATATVYAYSITLDPNGAELDGASTLYVAQGDVLNLGEVRKEYADFVSWYTQADYTDGQSDMYEGKGSEVVSGSVFTGSRDIYLYAYWTYEYITVSLYVGDSVYDTAEIKYNSTSFALPAVASSEQEYSFVGWFSGEDGSDVQYTSYSGVSNGTAFGYYTKLYAYFLPILSYQKATYGGETVYSVSANTRVDISAISEIKIPEKYTVDGEDYNLIVNADAFKGCTSLVTLEIPDTVKYIAVTNDGYRSGTGAFAGCSALRAVNVYSTGNATEPVYFSDDGVLFQKRSDSEGVEILYYPYAKTIDGGVYTLPSSVSNGDEYGTDGETPVTHDVVTIRSQVFRDRDLTGVVIAGSVTLVESEAFRDDKGLREVVFEDGGAGTLVIEDQAFRGCTGLTDVTIPARYSDFNVYAFTDCTALLNVYVGAGGAAYVSDAGVLLDSVGTTLVYYPQGRDLAKIDTSKLTSSSYTITKIGESAFASNTKITSVVISGNVTEIGVSAFEGCSSIASVAFEGDANSQSLTIKSRAFYGCYLISELDLPANLTTIEADAFGGCTSLETVSVNTYSSATVNFAAGSFGTTNNIKTVELGASVPVISNFGDAFDGGNLTSVIVASGNENYYSGDDGVLYDKGQTTIIYYPRGKTGEYVVPSTVTQIGTGVFTGRANLTAITIGANVNTVAAGAFEGCTFLAAIYVDPANTNFGNSYYKDESTDAEVSDGILYRRADITDESQDLGELVELVYCPIATFMAELEVAETVTAVAKGAFEDNTGVKTVKFTTPSDFTLGEEAFSGAAVESVTLPETITEIPKHAFLNCTELIFVNLPDGVTEIGEEAFWGTTSLVGDLTSTYVAGNYGIKLNEGLEKIDDYAFQDDTLLAVTIPSTVTKIGVGAFYHTQRDEIAEAPVTFAQSIKSETEPLRDGGTEEEDSGLEIGGYAFYQATYATGITIPARTTSFGEYAFAGSGTSNSTGVTTLVFEEGCRLTSLGNRAFNSIKNLQADVVLPGSVTSLGSYLFSNSTGLQSVTFGFENENSSLQSISTYAFSSTGLKSVSIPATVETIGSYAFNSCTSLETVEFEKKSDGTCSLTTIENYAFGGKLALKEITIPSSVTSLGTYMFYNDASLGSISFGDGGDTAQFTQMQNYFCEGCTSLTSITIPASVTTIGNRAFRGCTALTEVKFEEGSKITSMGDTDFYGCTALETFEFPETTDSSGTISLGTNMFEGDTLTSLTLSKSITDIGTALSGAKIESITVAEGNTVYNTNTTTGQGCVLYSGTSIAYVCYTITTTGSDGKITLTVPEGVTTIGGSAFSAHTEIQKVILPASLTSIGSYAFSGCTGLETVKIATGSNLAGDSALGTYAFNGCTSLTDINLPDGITAISEYCFQKCDMSNFTLPSGVTTVGARAFDSCTGITELDFTNVTALNNYVCNSCTSLKKVTLGTQWGSSVGSNLFYGCTSLETVIMPNGVESDTTATGSSMFYNCTSLTSVVVPEGITTLANNTFYGCTLLEDVTLPSTLTQINTGAFRDCASLASIDIPGSVANMGQRSFAGCTSLTSLVLPDSLASMGVTGTPGTYCFENCTSLESVIMGNKLDEIPAYTFDGCAKLAAFSVGSGVTTIGDYAFRNCESLEYVYTGKMTSSIGTDAFSGCSSLKEVEFGSLLSSIGARTFSGCSALESILIPSTVTSVGADAFASCHCDIYVQNTSNFAAAWTEGWGGTLTTVYYYSELTPSMKGDGTSYDGNYWHYDENGEIAVWRM